MPRAEPSQAENSSASSARGHHYKFRGAGRGRGNGPPDFADTEKRTEIEIDNLLVVAPPDFWTFHRLCNWFQTGAGSYRTNKYFILLAKNHILDLLKWLD